MPRFDTRALVLTRILLTHIGPLLRTPGHRGAVPDKVVQVEEFLVNEDVADAAHEVCVLHLELCGQVGQAAHLEGAC